MKVCPACGETYATFVDFCFADGEVLTMEVVAAPAAEPDGFDAPPPPKMLQGAQQGGGYTRSATPVPRARRPGRTLVQREGVYTPPAPDASYPPPTPTPTPADEREDEDDVIAMEDGTPPPPPTPREVPTSREGPGRKQPEPVITAFPSQELIAPASSGGPPRPQPILPDAPVGQVPTTARPGAAPVQAKPPKRQPRPAAQPVATEPEPGRSAIGIVLAGFAVFVGIAIVGTLLVVAISALVTSPGDSDGVVAVAPQPVPVEPVQVQPIAVDPVPVEPEPVVDPVPVEPEPVVPAPVDPEPVAPEPVAPVPVRPDPVAPVPVRPDPVRPVPAEPRPAPTARMGAVRFDSQPRRATILLDGTPIGTTPFMKPDVKFGSRTVRIEAEGYEPVTTTFVLDGPELTVPKFVLEPIGGTTPAPAPVEPVPGGTPAPAPVEPEIATFQADVRPRNIFFNDSLNQATGLECVVVESGVSVRVPQIVPLIPGTYTLQCATADGGVKQQTFAVESGWDPNAANHPITVRLR